MIRTGKARVVPQRSPVEGAARPSMTKPAMTKPTPQPTTTPESPQPTTTMGRKKLEHTIGQPTPSSATGKAGGPGAMALRLQALTGVPAGAAQLDAVANALESLLGVDASALQELRQRDLIRGKVELRVILDDAKVLTVPVPGRPPLQIEVPRSPYGTQAVFQLELGPPSSGDGKGPVLLGLSLGFDTMNRHIDADLPPLAKSAYPRILNPTALEGHKTSWKDKLVAGAKDALADVRVRGLQLGEDGQIKLQGEVVVLGRDHQDLQELARDQLPVVDTRLFRLGAATPTAAAPSSAPTPAGATPLLEMMQLFAKLAYGGSWKADLEVGTGPASPAGALRIEGELALNRDLNMQGGVRLTLATGAKTSVLEVQGASDTLQSTGELNVTGQTSHATSPLAGQVGVHWNKEGMSLKGLNVDALLPVQLQPWPGPGGAPAVGSPAFADRIDALLGSASPPLPGCEVTLIQRGDDVLQKRLEMIDRAGPGDTVLLQTFIFKDDLTGQQVIDSLVAAHQRGAHVKVLIDAVGSVRDASDLLQGPAAYRKLAAAGVDAALFNVPGKPLVAALPEALAGVRRELSRHHKHGLKGAPQMVADLKAAGLTNLATVVQAVVEAKHPERLAADPKRLLALALAAPRASDEVRRAGNLLPRAALRHLVELLSDELQKELPNVLRGLGRDHRKQLLVYGERDGKPFAEMDTGGNNIGDDYHLEPDSPQWDSAQHAGLPLWNDVDLHVTGSSIVGQAAREMERTWLASGGTGPAVAPVPDVPVEGTRGHATSTVRLVQHHPVGVQGKDGDDHYANVLLAALEGAGPGDRIAIENPYFIPLPALRDAMVAAARRGAHLRVVTNGLADNNDNLTVARMSRRFILPALVAEKNIEVYETRGDAQPVHRKTFAVEAASGTRLYGVGSHNLDHLSARINREMFVLGGSALDGKSAAADDTAKALFVDMDKDASAAKATRVKPADLGGGDLDAVAQDWLTSLLLPVL